MIVDASALLAIVFREGGYEDMLERILETSGTPIWSGRDRSIPTRDTS